MSIRPLTDNRCNKGDWHMVVTVIVNYCVLLGFEVPDENHPEFKGTSKWMAWQNAKAFMSYKDGIPALRHCAEETMAHMGRVAQAIKSAPKGTESERALAMKMIERWSGETIVLATLTASLNFMIEKMLKGKVTKLNEIRDLVVGYQGTISAEIAVFRTYNLPMVLNEMGGASTADPVRYDVN